MRLDPPTRFPGRGRGKGREERGKRRVEEEGVRVHIKEVRQYGQEAGIERREGGSCRQVVVQIIFDGYLPYPGYIIISFATENSYIGGAVLARQPPFLSS